MRKRIVVVVAFASLVALASTYAQTTNFFDLIATGTSQQIQAAIDQGVDLKAQNKDGMTALMYAAEHNANPEVITMLLKAGADGKAKDRQGKTAYDYAQKNAKLKGTDGYRLLNETQYWDRRADGGYKDTAGSSCVRLRPTTQKVFDLARAGDGGV